MKNSQKGSTTILIVVGILLVIAAGGYYFMMQKKQDVSEQIAGWKTYKNEEYGFEFQYPNNLIFQEGEIDDSLQIKLLSDQSIDPRNLWDIKEEQLYVDISVWKVNKISPREQNKKIFDSVEKNTTLGGIPASRIYDSHSWNEGDKPVTVHTTTYKDGFGYMVLYAPPETLRMEVIDKILSTFKFIEPKPTQEVSSETGRNKPVITSIIPNKGPKGTVVEIKGTNLSGFEGDLDIYFERSDGKRVRLNDPKSYEKTQDKLIKTTVIEPCKEGETVYGRYSGIPAPCDYVELTPGIYKVYVEPWGIKSNVVEFTLTNTTTVELRTDFEVVVGKSYVQAKQELTAKGWVVVTPTYTQSVVDKEFPEIGACGTGIDAICNVSFKKGNSQGHINVQKGGRSGYQVWTVVGSE